MPESEQVLRSVEASDTDVLLRWRNDASAFRWYRTPEAVTPDAHAEWFRRRLDQPSPALWILEVDGVPSGSVRLDVEGSVGVVSVVVIPTARGQGVGGALLRGVESEARALGLTQLHAEIHPDNVASRRLFDSAGYQPIGVAEDGFTHLGMTITEA